MKTTFTFYIFLCLLLTFANTTAHSQSTLQYSFNESSSLISGHTSYRCVNVSPGISPIVTNVTGINGASTVKYLSFNAIATDKAVLLSWITASEMNNSHFEVERSFDMTSFKTIAIVLDGFDAENHTKNYQLKDYSSSGKDSPVIYYRLKQIDMDGTISHSNVLTVRSQDKAEGLKELSRYQFAHELTFCVNPLVNCTAEITM